MEHLKWKLCKKYDEFNSNIIVKAIKESFIYNLLKALIVILLILLLIFQIKPKKAYIYAELEQVEDYTNFAERLDIESCNDTIIYSNDKIIIDLDGLSINNIDYSDGDYLVIYSEEDSEGKHEASISIWGEMPEIYFYDAILVNIIDQCNTIYSNYASYQFIKEQKLRIYSGTAYIINVNNKKKEKLDCTETLILVNTPFKDTSNDYRHIFDSILNNDDISKNFNDIIDEYNKAEKYFVNIYTSNKDSESLDDKLENSIIGFNNMYSEQLTLCKIVASGKLTVSYTPTPEEYTLNKQELYLLSEDSSLTISYDSENNTAFVSGYVNEATLSQMNLFPDFWNWYFSNVYMAPLTLVSTVFAAVSMMNASKKK